MDDFIMHVVDRGWRKRDQVIFGEQVYVDEACIQKALEEFSVLENF